MERLRTYLLFVFGLFSLSILNAQELDSLLDVVVFDELQLFEELEESTNASFLYPSISYESKSLFAGRDYGVDQFAIGVQLYYFNMKGLLLGAGSYGFSEYSPTINTSVLTIGYAGKQVDRKLNYLVSYDKYIFSSSDSVDTGSYTSSVNLNLSLEAKYTGASLNGSLMFGSEVGGQINANLFAKLYLLNKDIDRQIYLEPMVSFMFGSETVINSNIGINRVYYTESDEFGYLNTKLSIPLNIDWKNFEIQAAYNYNFPHALSNVETYSNQGSFTFSIAYLIAL